LDHEDLVNFIRTTKGKIVLAAAVIIALAIPKLLMDRPAAPGARKDKRLSGPVTVSIIVAKPESMQEKVVTTGTLLPSENVELMNEISGRVARISFTEGSAVQKGALLVKINDADLQAQLQKATANLVVANDKEARQKVLLEQAAISREMYESTVRDLASARADVALLNAQIEKTEIRAPFNGKIGLRYVSEGSYLPVGTMIASCVSTNPLRLEFAVPEQYFSRITTGTALSYTIQGIETPFTGSIYAGEPKVDEATRSVRFRALCPNPGNKIPSGAFAKVEIALGDKKKALLVPSEALVPTINGQNLYVIKAGMATLVPITIGTREAARVEINAGLAAGDTVVASGVLMLQPGALVRISGAD